MDPDACWQRILDAIGDQDWLTVSEAVLDLSEWLSKGGFLPEVFREAWEDYGPDGTTPPLVALFSAVLHFSVVTPLEDS